VDPAMAVAVVIAVIGAAGTVQAAWVQGRAQRGSGRNAPGPEEEAIPRLAGDGAGRRARPGPSSR
jgi:hypothetical protein